MIVSILSFSDEVFARAFIFILPLWPVPSFVSQLIFNIFYVFVQIVEIQERENMR